jgi:hypothetical protein
MASWTHNQCLACWKLEHANRREPILMTRYAQAALCCFCGKTNTDGIYVRRDGDTLALCQGHTNE